MHLLEHSEPRSENGKRQCCRKGIQLKTKVSEFKVKVSEYRAIVSEFHSKVSLYPTRNETRDNCTGNDTKFGGCCLEEHCK